MPPFPFAPNEEAAVAMIRGGFDFMFSTTQTPAQKDKRNVPYHMSRPAHNPI